MKKILFLCLFSVLHGALPPLYETLAEFKSLLESPILTERLTSADAIESVERTEKGFVVTTNKSILEIERIYDKTAMIGPQKFHFEFYAKRARESATAGAAPLK